MSQTQSLSTVNECLVELVYSKFSGHYSKKNWVSDYPLWNTLSEEDKQFWKELVMGVRCGYRKDLMKSQKVDPEPKSNDPSLEY